jgi:hypothetical protein
MSVLGKVGIALASVVGAVGLVYGVVKLDEQLKSKKNIDQLKDATSGNELADVLASHGVASVKALNS